MPILGNRNSINELYQKQMQEYSDFDKNINKRVFDMTKMQTQKFSQDVPQQDTAITEGEKVSMQQNIENFTKQLEKINNLLSIENATRRKLSADKITQLLEVQPLISNYNAIMRIIKNPNISRTSRAIFEVEVNKVMPYLQQISQRFYTLITHYMANELIVNTQQQANPRNQHHQDPDAYARSYIIPQMISVYSVLELMIRNINNRSYEVLDLQNVQNEFSKIIMRDFPEVKQIENIYNMLQRDTRKLNTEKIQIFENEIGRRLTDDEKIRYINQLGLKPDFSPVFGENTRRALTGIINETNNTIVNDINRYTRMFNEAQNALVDINNGIDIIGDELEDDNLPDDKREELEKKLDELHASRQKTEDLVDIYRDKKDQTVNIIADAHEYTRRKGIREMEKPSSDKNPPKVGDGKKKKIYRQRKGNNLMSYNDEENDLYIK